MATIRLIPSTYAVSSTSYLSVSDASNMYANTDSTTYATITNTNTSTSSRYLYLRGFNFDDIPSNAIINSFAVHIKGYESGLSTSTSYAPRLADNTTAISGTTASYNFGTSTTTITIPTGTLTWEDIVDYGSSFTIMVYVRRNNRNTTGYFYCYGAEIEVDYALPVSATVTSTLTGNGTIAPSGATATYEGTEYTLTITPTNMSDTITVTNNGTDVSSSVVAHYPETNASNVLGTYSLESGGFNSGESWFQGIVGNGYDTTETTTSNYYSSGSGTTAVFQYDVSFTNIPSNATITRMYMMANGHAESTSNSSEYMCVQLKSGSTEFTEQYNFKSAGTSNTTQTIEATTLPTVSQLASLVVECTLGYYGGAINGVTVFVEYEVSGASIEYFTYTYTVTGNATIAVVIGSAATDALYLKVNGSWAAVEKAYLKVNGSWVEQDISTLFDANTKYVKGN